MSNLYYCLDCKRIFSDVDKCAYCSGENIKELATNAPVNVIGSKLKGKVLNIKGDMIRILIKGDGGSKMVKEYKSEQLRKVL